ncbi:MAG TPA: FAD-dependent oxidoreductase [Actinomycetota bacterium]|jgi:sarcosine oxidase subunit beta|nr:FAD-dependent oxidoreductase [Actinomycetota bacterium]
MTGLLRRRVFLRRSEVRPRYDVVIVGGGVNGLSLAYNLAATQGVRSVGVFERAYIGSGSSGRNTQVIRANYNTPENVPLYRRSMEIWRTLSAELDFNIMFSTQGELDLCHTIDTLEVERDKSLLNRAYGVETVILTPDEVLRTCPLVDVTGGGELPVIGASYHPPGSIARHDSVVWGYASAAQRLGVDVHERVAVTGVNVTDRACTGVTIEGGATVEAGCVVSAVAGSTSVVAAMAGLTLPISTHPLQAFVTEPYGHALNGLVSSMDLFIYVSQTARGELLAGAEILPYNTYSTGSTFDFLAEASKRSIQILPFMAKAYAMRQWAGLCDMTPDSSPILGESEVRNFHLMTGMGTWGFKGSPVFGATMAELIVTGRTPELIAPFAPNRFANDRMVPDAASAGTH